MTRKQEDEDVVRSVRAHQTAIRRMRGPKRFPVVDHPIKPTTPLDRISWEQRLKYGFELLGQGEE